MWILCVLKLWARLPCSSPHLCRDPLAQELARFPQLFLQQETHWPTSFAVEPQAQVGAALDAIQCSNVGSLLKWKRLDNMVKDGTSNACDALYHLSGGWVGAELAQGIGASMVIATCCQDYSGPGLGKELPYRGDTI